jgi:bacterial/archaeal transporter family-2 protein
VTAARNASPWMFSGGLIGVLFVTVTLVAAPRIGMTGVIVSALAGQALGGLLIDSFGWFGLEARPIDLRRAAGIALLVGAVWLLNSRPTGVK